MTFDFRAADGHLYHLDTEAGEIHCIPLDAQEQPVPLEPCDEVSE
jgi:hypothetical protein